MPIHNFAPLDGRIEHFVIKSKALANNMLGDPHERTVAVYLPPGYDSDNSRYPLLVDLAGFTGSALKHTAWKAFGESIPQRIDRLVRAGAMGPVICAFPDCFTSLGGNQYVDSVAMGMWEEYLTVELIGALESKYQLLEGAAHRACFGKSSGGYGALIHGLKHADTWGAVACHSGDVAFDLAYRGDMAATMTQVAKHGSFQGFLHHFEEARDVNGREMHALMILAMAATYDPDPRSYKGIRLPVDPRTCELDPERWQAWLAHDPLVLLENPSYQANLAKLRGLFIDCGSRDQYHLHYGSRAFTDRLRELGIEHRYEEFEDNHSGIDYRMDVSFPYLYAAISE